VQCAVIYTTQKDFFGRPIVRTPTSGVGASTPAHENKSLVVFNFNEGFTNAGV
jgi:hypothetical protein